MFQLFMKIMSFNIIKDNHLYHGYYLITQVLNLSYFLI